ncbi:MAG: glycerophosphodiester phosphodiesterase [Clostridia bacterium]|nr:glycerophosphodiester phosphodiesterase [Clostridia bacterium]
MLFFILLLIALILFLIAPACGKRRAEHIRGAKYAHRGLHNAQVSENSLAAFERACQTGYGIELDVQLSRDGHVVVFHDDDLRRMTGDFRRVDEVDLAELQSLPLPDGSRIPAFAEVLACVAGRVPLLVEIKNGRRNPELCKKVMAHLRAYAGEYVIESFNPLILLWLRRNAPDVVRGQLVSPLSGYRKSHIGLAQAFALSTLLLNFLSRPDFVAYDVSALHFLAPRIQRTLFRTPMAAWTVRAPSTPIPSRDALIFEVGTADSE